VWWEVEQACQVVAGIGDAVGCCEQAQGVLTDRLDAFRCFVERVALEVLRDIGDSPPAEHHPLPDLAPQPVIDKIDWWRHQVSEVAILVNDRNLTGAAAAPRCRKHGEVELHSAVVFDGKSPTVVRPSLEPVDEDIDDLTGLSDEFEATSFEFLDRERLGVADPGVDVGELVASARPERAIDEQRAPVIGRVDRTTKIGDDPCVRRPIIGEV